MSVSRTDISTIAAPRAAHLPHHDLDSARDARDKRSAKEVAAEVGRSYNTVNKLALEAVKEVAHAEIQAVSPGCFNDQELRGFVKPLIAAISRLKPATL
ncbi:hypothetical protein ACLQ3C_15535 [Gordonia sp. DT30]|uniref:hypothetical protein n=1 Tax=Gordonia sp. DT30 TaxID=3416546 RepID=UPI003CF2E87F